jgi:hypothetical protein
MSCLKDYSVLCLKRNEKYTQKGTSFLQLKGNVRIWRATSGPKNRRVEENAGKGLELTGPFML